MHHSQSKYSSFWIGIQQQEAPVGHRDGQILINRLSIEYRASKKFTEIEEAKVPEMTRTEVHNSGVFSRKQEEGKGRGDDIFKWQCK